MQQNVRGAVLGETSSASDTSSFTDGSKSLPATTTKKRVISDPRHFLLQTWWRPKKRRRTLSTFPFSLQQCVVVNSEQSPVVAEIKERESGRSQSRRCTAAPNLELRCPNCKREFTVGWLVRNLRMFRLTLLYLCSRSGPFLLFTGCCNRRVHESPRNQVHEKNILHRI